ncbi:MAG: VRR-NUC domain-containing protein [Alloprevotella sp.]
MDKKTDNIVRHAEVSEKVLERYLATRVKAQGGLCLKYSNAGMVGYPDRVCLMPGGRTVWVELKSKGKKPTTLQGIRFGQMRRIGHRVYVCDSKAGIDEVLTTYKNEEK